MLEPLYDQDFQHMAHGDSGIRTHDLLNAIQALSQLSYTPMFNFCCFADRTNCILAEYYPFVNYFFRFFTN